MKINIVFDGPPGPESGRFVETENLDGRGVGVGEWKPYRKGATNTKVADWWVLQIEVPDDTVRT